MKAFQTASGMAEAAGRSRPLAFVALLADESSPPRPDGKEPGALVRIAREESVKMFQRSLGLLDQLNFATCPERKAVAPISPFAHHYLAKMLMEKGSPEEVLRHQTAAIELRKSLAAEFPKQLSHRVDLALSLSNLGAILTRQGKNTEALDSARGANAIQRALVEEHPEDPQLQSTLALSTVGMAVNLNALGRWKESRPLHIESVEIMSRVVAENPAVTEFRAILASLASQCGQYLIDHDEIEAGLIALAKARDQGETIRRTNPNDVRNLNSLASIHRGIGKSRAKQGKIADALDSLRQAIAIGERIASEDTLFTYDLACGLALYSEFVGRDQSTPAKDPNKNSEHYSDKAMAVLLQAVDRGWKEADWTERDPELRSLRARPDFQELIKTLRRKIGSAPTGR